MGSGVRLGPTITRRGLTHYSQTQTPERIRH